MNKLTTLTCGDLPQHRVVVAEPGQSADPEWTRCEIGQNIEFDTLSLESHCLADWSPVVYDAFVVAAAIEYCDRTKARGRHFWGRDILLRVPVHDPVRWNEADVGPVLAVLTGDRWRVEFVRRATPAPRARQIPLTMDGNAWAIMPFSNGLDSFAVSRLMKKEDGMLLKVRLGVSSRQGKAQLPFAGVPFRVTGRSFRESSFRSRAFKFALLSGVAAHLARLNVVIVAESGQGILGPSLVPVGQEHEDLRSHPYFLDRMSAFLGRLLETDIRFSYPRMWHTKAETLSEYFRTYPDQNDAWERTRSCWQDQRYSSVGGLLRQCGICAACLLRRMSLHAVGRSENRSNYIWESLDASSFPKGAAAGYEVKGKAMRDHFISGVTVLDQLAKLPKSPWDQHTLSRQVRRLFRSPDIINGGSVNEAGVRAKVLRLVDQHASEWQEFKNSLGESSFLVQLLESRKEDA